MKKSLVISVLLVLAFVSFASAVTTTLEVQTFSGHNIMVSALKPGSVYNLIESYYTVSDYNGKATININTDNIDEFDLKVWIKKGNDVVVSKKFEGFTAGQPINLEVYPDSYVKPTPVVNDTVNVTENDTEVLNETNTTTENITENTVSQPSITGHSTSQDTGSTSFFSKNMVYIFVGIILLAAFIFMGMLSLKRRKSSYSDEDHDDVKVRKLSDYLEERKHHSGNDAYKKSLDDAQRKLDEAQEEIRRLKNTDKIEAAKKKLVEDERELMRLRKGL